MKYISYLIFVFTFSENKNCLKKTRAFENEQKYATSLHCNKAVTNVMQQATIHTSTVKMYMAWVQLRKKRMWQRIIFIIKFFLCYLRLDDRLMLHFQKLPILLSDLTDFCERMNESLQQLKPVIIIRIYIL